MNINRLIGLAGNREDVLEEALAMLGHLASVGDSLRIDTATTGFWQEPGDDESGSESEGDPRVRRLRLAETRYRVLIEQIPVVTFLALLDGSGNEIYVSPQIESLLGYTQEEWVSDPVLWYRQVHPDDRARLSRDFAAMCIVGEPFRGVVRVFTRDGRLRWVHMEARFVCDERGRPLFLQGAGFDVSEQYEVSQARESLVREQAAREEAERERGRLLELFSSLPAAITVLHGPDHIVQFANPVALLLAGPGSEVVGKPWRVAFPQFGHETLRMLDTVRATGERFSLSEHPFRGGRGRERYFNFACEPLPDARGGDTLLFTHAVEVTEEISARREVEQALQLRDEALAKLRDAVRTREQFLSAAAHDLKTPLAAVSGWAQLLRRRIKRELSDVTWLDDGVSVIEREATRMASMVAEFLDLTRLQSGMPIELERRPVDLVRLVEEVVADEQMRTERHEILLETSEPSLVGVWDAARLGRVISNLLDNAAKYSPDGGPIRVRVERERDRGSRDIATVRVEDRGVGIPANELSRIFEQFHRATNVVGRIAGTGVGLSASHQIVALHGGQIDVVSEEGTGSTFTVRLPMEDE